MLVELKDLKKSFTTGDVQTTVLSGIDYQLKPSEMCLVMGPSGCGKTTLLNILGGIDAATSGNVIVDGVDITLLSSKELVQYRRDKVGFIFQFYNLLPTLTALENVKIGIEHVLRNNGEADVRAREYLKMVGLGDKLTHYPQQLSAGQQQRVAIARALSKKPTLILADEPTGNLDEDTGKEILDLMTKLNKELGITFVIVTHDVELRSYATQVLQLNHGKLVKAGSG